MRKRNERKVTWFSCAMIFIGLAMIAISVYAVIRDPSLDLTDRLKLMMSPFFFVGLFMVLIPAIDAMIGNTAKWIVFNFLVLDILLLSVLMIFTPVGEIKPVIYQCFAAASYGLIIFFGILVDGIYKVLPDDTYERR